VFGTTLDSWEPRFRPPAPVVEVKQQEKVPEIIETKAPVARVVPIEPAKDTDYVTETRTARRMRENKVRRKIIGISVSPEEQALIRKHVAEMNTTFSEWARGVLFKAMGRKVPARPKRD